jgi:hypothetical protein
MWMIRSLTKKDNHRNPQYWSKELGWTWREFATEFTNEERETYLLPSGGVWVEMN